MEKNNNTDLALIRDIDFLGDLLGEVLNTHGGQPLLDMVEHIKNLTRSWRMETDEKLHGKIESDVRALIAGLTFETRQDVIRAYATYFHLVNVAEQNHRVRRNRCYQQEDTKTSQNLSIENTIVALKESGYSIEDIRDALPHLSLQLIITAHPTEATKRQILNIQKRLGFRLKELDNPFLTENEQLFIKENILNEVVRLWQTNELNSKKPEVIDEVKTGLYYFDNTFFDILPDIHREVEVSLRKHFPGQKWKVPNFLRIGSWIGGDRDGNPFVTSDVTWSTLATQRDLVLQKYLQGIDYLVDRYSYCTTRIKVTDELNQLIDEKENEYLSPDQKWPVETEVYRRVLAIIRLRLTKVGIEGDVGYKNPEELLKELRIIRECLRFHLPFKDELRRINRFIRQIEIFGFHLASLEARNNSAEHEWAISEILAKVNIVKDYGNLSEQEKVGILSNVLSDPRPLLLLGESYTEKTREVIATFKTIKHAHDEFGAIAIPTYLISMTQACSDLLEVLVFAKEVGLYYVNPDGVITSTLNIAPLFETIRDLETAPEVMLSMFDMPVYKHHLSLLGNKQEIMVGYSDGSKDGGCLAAQWKIYKAQIEITKLAEDFGIQVKFFHGRGGSLGRGGGPISRSILSQPPQTLINGVKITEQGEVLSTRYLLREIAARNLEQAASTLLQNVTIALKTSKEPDMVYHQQEWIDALDEIAGIAFKKYRSLVFDDGQLFAYYNDVSPLNKFASLNIGSRPMHRVAKPSFTSLRAIPWVFGWIQNRQMIPGWYSAGTGLQDFAGAKEGNLELMRKMYKEWPLFNVMISNLHHALMMADMKVGQLYTALAKDQNAGEKIFSDIRDEYERTKNIILQIAEVGELLEHFPYVRESTLRRNSHLDPLNFLQVELLNALHGKVEVNKKVQQELLTQVLLTINGIVLGLRNTG